MRDAIADTLSRATPLTDEQLDYMGTVATVKDVGFYFGGDVLYWLDGVPRTWHEARLSSA